MTKASLRSKDLLGIEPLTPDEIALLLDTAESMRAIGRRSIKKVPALRGRMVVNLFFEASTRTRFSFETAEKWLSADSLNFAAKGSSVEKGESLLDTARNLQAMSPDLIVIRHGSPGVPHFLARHLKAGVVNAGDGAHEHPTQALLDALTIRQRLGQLEGLRVVDRGRHRALARRAVEHLAADEDGGASHRLRAADAASRRGSRRWASRRRRTSTRRSRAPTSS